jgi:hypothetical protein
MAQAQPEALSSHIAIDIDDDGGTSCCAVCMEPSEWVAVGACGHREVCINCAVRMRFFRDDRRCCICRAFCPTVLVTKAAADDDGQQHLADRSQRQQAAVLFSKTTAPPAFVGAIPPAGTYCWYHGGMAAFFDDRVPYEAVRKMCSKPLCPPRAGDNPRAPADSWTGLRFFLLYLAGMTLLGASSGIPIAMYLKPWIYRVLVVLAFGFASAGYTCFSWKG